MLVIEKAIDIFKSNEYIVENTDCALREILNDMNLKTCDCETTSCNECLKQSLTLLSQEYKEPIELTQFEYDLIDTINLSKQFNCQFFLTVCNNLKREKGYFKGVEDTSMTLKEILENCVVKKDGN